MVVANIGVRVNSGGMVCVFLTSWYISQSLVFPSLDLPVISHAAWLTEVRPGIHASVSPKTPLSRAVLPGNQDSDVFTTGHNPPRPTNVGTPQTTTVHAT